MEFRTNVAINKSSTQINLGDKFVTLGSCFANSMSQKLKDSKFDTFNNPLGILYDPRSIARAINFALTGNRPDKQTYVQTGSHFANLLTHSDMDGQSQEACAQQIDKQLNNLRLKLKEADWLILTLGTSWVYYQNSTGLQVANCHKIPQKEFRKDMLGFDRTQLVYDNLIQFLKEFNPSLKIIITVSPVRHTKDTLALNNLSKSHLFLLSHYLDKTYEHVHYYPAYELLVDELRDYRFYKSDMIHPTEQAVDFIWNHFCESYINTDTITNLNELEKLQKAITHRPFNPSSDKHQSFIKSTLNKLELLNKKLNLSSEIEELKRQLL